MAENITLSNVSTFTNDTTAVNTINNNNSIITNAFIDVLSRSGIAPNQMLSTLDMNSNQMINLPPPATINSPARLVDVTSPAQIASVPPVGTSGAVVGLLNGNNTYSGISTFTNSIILNGATSGSSTIKVAAVAGSSTFQLPVGNGSNGQVLQTDGSGNTSWVSANVSTGITITPAANTLNPAIITTQSLSGTTVTTLVPTTPNPFQFPAVNGFIISSDTVDGSLPGNALDGWQFNHQFGGATLKGARQVLDIIGALTAPTNVSNTNRNYVAGVFEMNALSGDGGTNTGAGAQGAVFGINPVVRTTPSATNLNAVVGGEIDVNHTGTSRTRMGLNIVSFPTNQGVVIDSALIVGSAATAGSIGWHNGILFSKSSNGANPVDASGTLINAEGAGVTVANGIDLSAYTFTNNAIHTPNFSISPSGGIAQSSTIVSTWSLDSSIATFVIANGANQQFSAGAGMVLVHDIEDNDVALYLCSGATATLVTSSLGTHWVAGTTTPAAGKLSVGFGGVTYGVYNNQGASRTIAISSFKTKPAA